MNHPIHNAFVYLEQAFSNIYTTMISPFLWAYRLQSTTERALPNLCLLLSTQSVSSTSTTEWDMLKLTIISNPAKTAEGAMFIALPTCLQP